MEMIRLLVLLSVFYTFDFLYNKNYIKIIYYITLMKLSNLVL
jgi:hypothetical protein